MKMYTIIYLIKKKKDVSKTILSHKYIIYKYTNMYV